MNVAGYSAPSTRYVALILLIHGSCRLQIEVAFFTFLAFFDDQRKTYNALHPRFWTLLRVAFRTGQSTSL